MIEREALGRLVREVWIEWAREQPNPKPSWLVPWDELSERDREVDRRIGERLAATTLDQEEMIASLRARLGRLRAERDRFAEDNRRFHTDAPDETHWSGLVQANSELRAENERLTAQAQLDVMHTLKELHALIERLRKKADQCAESSVIFRLERDQMGAKVERLKQELQSESAAVAGEMIRAQADAFDARQEVDWLRELIRTHRNDHNDRALYQAALGGDDE
jgi:hypothetical protein